MRAPATRHSSGYGSLDRLAGGGLLPATSLLLTGGAGVGKSTLLAQILCAVAAASGRVVAVLNEEPEEVGRERLRRLGAPVSPRMEFVATRRLPDVMAAIARARPNVVGVDSLGRMVDPASTERAATLEHMAAVATVLRASAWTEARRGGGPVVIATAHANAGWAPGDAADPGLSRVGEAVHTHLHMARDGADVVVTCVRNELGPAGGSARFRFAGAWLVECEDTALPPWPDLTDER